MTGLLRSWTPFAGAGQFPLRRHLLPGTQPPDSCVPGQVCAVSPGSRSQGRLAAAYKAAHNERRGSVSQDIAAGDIDKDALAQAERNAKRAGVKAVIEFMSRNALDIEKRSGLIVCNPPTGKDYRLPKLPPNSSATLCTALSTPAPAPNCPSTPQDTGSCGTIAASKETDLKERPNKHELPAV